MISKMFAKKRSIVAALALTSALSAGMANAAVDEVHFLIPGGLVVAGMAPHAVRVKHCLKRVWLTPFLTKTCPVVVAAKRLLT